MPMKAKKSTSSSFPRPRGLDIIEKGNYEPGALSDGSERGDASDNQLGDASAMARMHRPREASQTCARR